MSDVCRARPASDDGRTGWVSMAIESLSRADSACPAGRLTAAPDAQGQAPAPSRRPRRAGLRELALIAVVYAMYDGSRFLVEGRQATALAHAVRILHLESLMHLDIELQLNQVVSAHRVLAVGSDYVYATLHYIVTPVVLVWLWRAHRHAYSQARTSLVVATVIGLVGFSLVPVAPPRMLPGFVDTMAQYSSVGWWGGDASAPRGVGSFTNQFAAMPSLHVGWAMWCGYQLWRHARAWVWRAAGVVYPLLVTFVVVATANHYLADAVAGAVVITVAMAGVRVASPRRVPHRVIDLTLPAQRRSATG